MLLVLPKNTDIIGNWKVHVSHHHHRQKDISAMPHAVLMPVLQLHLFLKFEYKYVGRFVQQNNFSLNLSQI